MLVGWFRSLLFDQSTMTQMAFYVGLVLIVVFCIVNFSKIQAAMKTRSVRYGSVAGVTVLLVLGILALVNFLNFRHHGRLDLTEEKLYSISDQSRKVVDNLETEISIYGFFTTEMGRINFQDLMQEYRYGSSNLVYAVIDPQEDPGTAVQYEITRDGQVVVASGDKREMVDDFTEEKITNAIIKVTREEEKFIYFLNGHGERELDGFDPEGLSVAKEAIEKQNYQVESYNLAQENQIPADATVIISAGPKVDFLPNEEVLLNQYLALGGKFLLMVDPDSKFKMDDFLARYGFALGGKTVIDGSGLGQVFGLGAAAPLVAEYQDHPITSGLGRVMTFFPMAQGLTTTESDLGYETVALAKTSPSSWAESDLESGEVAFDEGQDTEGPLDLVIVATLSVDSETTAQGEGEEESMTQEDVPETSNSTQREARFALYGDSDFAANGYFDGGANGDLFLMTVSWLAEEADLIAIRPKSPENRRIEVTFGQSRLLFLVTVILLPLATLVLGISVWRRRK